MPEMPIQLGFDPAIIEWPKKEGERPRLHDTPLPSFIDHHGERISKNH